MTEPTITIIIPVYNAGQYLQPLFASIEDQTYKQWCALFVVDCPSDGSENIINRYITNDNRFNAIYNSENKHIGHSRNLGLQMTVSEYVTFVDHDDILEPDFLETLMHEAHRADADIVLSKQNDYNNDHIDTKCYIDKRWLLEDLLTDGGAERSQARFVNIHGVIYRTRLLQENNITFVDTRSTTPEDRIFQYEAISCSKKIGYIPIQVYHHRHVQNSEGHTASYLSIKKRAKGYEYWDSLIGEREHELLLQNIAKYCYRQISGTLWPPIVRIKYIKDVREQIHQYPIFIEALENSKIPQPGNVLKAAFRIIVKKLLE